MFTAEKFHRLWETDGFTESLAAQRCFKTFGNFFDSRRESEYTWGSFPPVEEA